MEAKAATEELEALAAGELSGLGSDCSTGR